MLRRVHLHVWFISHATSSGQVLSAAENIPDQPLPIVEVLRTGA